jgi:hypothetical protein
MLRVRNIPAAVLVFQSYRVASAILLAQSDLVAWVLKETLTKRLRHCQRRETVAYLRNVLQMSEHGPAPHTRSLLLLIP